ncbi:MAG: ABC transporter permease [Elusimicrobiota bacterium]
MFLTKLALKNLIRHRNRTVITSVIIAFAIFFYILMDSMIAGMVQMSYDSVINFESGHLQILTKKYREKEDKLPLENLLVDPKGAVSKAEKIEGYLGSSVELDFQARLNNGVNELPIVGRGIRPEKFQKIFNLNDRFVEGEMLSSGKYEVVMGKKLARLLNLEVGDYATLLVKDKNETFNTIEARISGLVHTGNPNVNSNIVYVPLDVARRALAVTDRASKVKIKLEKKDLAREAGAVLDENLTKEDKRIDVVPWQELEAISIAGAKQAGNQLIAGVILLIAAIAIINTVILAALERMEEIGMMKALGMSRAEIIYTFVAESTGIGLLGGLVGIIMGGFGVWLFTIYGIDWGALTGTEMASFGVPVIGKMYGVWNPGSFVFVFFFGIIVSCLSSIPPAYWAADKDPVKSIYHR